MDGNSRFEHLLVVNVNIIRNAGKHLCQSGDFWVVF